MLSILEAAWRIAGHWFIMCAHTVLYCTHSALEVLLSYKAGRYYLSSEQLHQRQCTMPIQYKVGTIVNSHTYNYHHSESIQGIFGFLCLTLK